MNHGTKTVEEWYLNGKMGERRIYKNGKIVKN